MKMEMEDGCAPDVPEPENPLKALLDLVKAIQPKVAKGKVTLGDIWLTEGVVEFFSSQLRDDPSKTNFCLSAVMRYLAMHKQHLLSESITNEAEAEGKAAVSVWTVIKTSELDAPDEILEGVDASPEGQVQQIVIATDFRREQTMMMMPDEAQREMQFPPNVFDKSDDNDEDNWIPELL